MPESKYQLIAPLSFGKACIRISGAIEAAGSLVGIFCPDKVPFFDGVENGEEFQCAQAIDSLSCTRFWIRNVAKHVNSFWLPTSSDKFYPDFVVSMKDGRLLIVEYKGAHIADSRDTAEKRTIGESWERYSDGKGLFLITEKLVDGMNVREQLIRKARIC